MAYLHETMEPATTEITITPDGRVFVFGLSRTVLEICCNLNPHDAQLGRRLAHVRTVEPAPVSAINGGDQS
jgi:hypothetical protein